MPSMPSLKTTTIMQKRWEWVEYDIHEATTLQQALKIHPTLCQLLVQRGITTFEQARQFFRPQLAHLHDPFLMKDMDRAVQRLGQALIKKEKILVYGDYDVDGTTSVALLYRFLSAYHSELDYYLPSRYSEGYGISLRGVEYAEEQGCTLMVALDCGIKAHEPIAYAREKGIDVIVCDHHLPDAELPDAHAILNPKQPDCPYPYKQLSGCAIGFKLIQAFGQYYDLDLEREIFPFLDLVAVSLASDYVALTGENRVLAHFGLKQLNSTPRIGLLSLMNALPSVEAYAIRDIVFGITPHLNAAGRLAHARLAVQLLLATDEPAADALTDQLLALNQERRDIEREVVAAAQAQIQQNIAFAEQRALLLRGEDWHQGVLGIVAAKMVEYYHKPSVVVTEVHGRLTGSIRSVEGFDVHQALEQCADLLVSFGGHQQAAGLTLKPQHWEAFCERFEGIAAQSLAPEQLLPMQRIDAALKLEELTDTFWRILEQFAPFGPSNMRPIFATQHVVDAGYSSVVKQQHLKLVLQPQGGGTPVKGIAFGQARHLDRVRSRQPFELCYVIEPDRYRGGDALQLNVRDMRFRQ